MLILNLILFIALLGVVWWLINFIPMPPPFPAIIQGLFIIVAVLAVLNVFAGVSLLGVSVPRLV